MSESNVSAPKRAVKSVVPFAALPHQLRRDLRLHPRAVVLAASLLEFARDKATCWPSNARLARDMGCSRRTIQLTLTSLCETGWIAVEHKPATPKNPTGRVIHLLWRERKPGRHDGDKGIPGVLTIPKKKDVAPAATPGIDAESTLLDLPLGLLIEMRMDYLRSLPYGEYLLTRHWRDCRTRAIERAGGECGVCTARHGLDVHHRTYARFGEEADSDLIVLCRPCHGLFHDNGKLALPSDPRIATQDEGV